MKISMISILFLVAVISVAYSQDYPEVNELLDAIDENMVFQTAYVEGDMVIHIKKRVITKTFRSYSQGTERSFLEFLSPARDRGTKILKIDDVVKIYYPSAERILRLSGHMLRQSMMGSDFSYEDMTERASRLRDEYEGAVTGVESMDDRRCYVVTLTATDPDETYHTRKIWVDCERFVGLKEELYARSGKLLKVMTAGDIRSYGGRFYPMRITLEDKLRESSMTEMRITRIDFDVTIPPGTFIERNLLRK